MQTFLTTPPRPVPELRPNTTSPPANTQDTHSETSEHAETPVETTPKSYPHRERKAVQRFEPTWYTVQL